MFDKAFDSGLITFSDDYRLLLSNELRDQQRNAYMAATFFAHQGAVLQLPSKFSPDATLLAWHREHCFVGEPL